MTRRPKRTVSIDEAAQMLRHYADGKTMRQIGKLLDRSLSVVQRVCEPIARPTGRRANPERDARDALCWKLRKEGRTYAEIAATIGIKSPGRAHALTLRGRAMERATI